MRQLFLNHDRGSELILFFSGFGQDPRPFAPLTGETAVYMVYDYADPAPLDPEALEGFERISLVAWSMGVMTAPWSAAPLKDRIVRAAAVNGTPWGIALTEDEPGIPRALWQETAAAMDADGLERFVSLMTLGGRYYREHRPRRTPPECRRELEALLALRERHPRLTPFEYTEIISGRRDRIFPPALTRAAFAGRGVREYPGAHFDERLFAALLGGRA